MEVLRIRHDKDNLDCTTLLRALDGCFLDGFDVLKLYIHRLPAKAAQVSGSHFWKKSVYHGGTPEGKTNLIQDI